MFNSWGLINSYGSFASYYKEHLLAMKGLLLINLIGSTQCFLALLLSGIVGRLLDAGYCRSIIATGTVLLSSGLFVLSSINGQASNDGMRSEHGSYLLIWLTHGLLPGLGTACFSVTSAQGASTAGLIYPILIRYVIGLAGFPTGVRSTAAVATVTSIFALVTVRPNPTQIFRKPAQGWVKVQTWIDTHAISNPAFVWLMAATCFMFFSFHAVYFSLEQWTAAESFGVTKSPTVPDLPNELPKHSIRTFWLLSIMNALSTFGRLGSAYLSDHFGALNIHIAVTSFSAILVLLLWTLTHTLQSAIAFAVLFGIASGSAITLPPASTAHILGPTPEAQAKLGQWTGMIYSASAVFALTCPIIAGHLVRRFGTYLAVQLGAGACLTLSVTCMVMSRIYLGRQRRDQAEEGTLSPSSSEEEHDSREKVQVRITEM
ncbi:MAG: hypothetical protein M1821_007983 [Bathelium mastoideum]|nr:MAG: hypothetical protein M1821_007983 [Bathelium mastoideum]